MSFISFWRRNLGCARLAVLSQLEYRFNLFADAVLQPVMTAGIEVALWSAIMASSGHSTIAGFPKAYYIAYGLWSAFFDRISANWMYEMRMIDEIDSGSVNSVLARPISFYEYYLAQFMGYKILTALVSLCVPVAICTFLSGPTDLSRLPAAFCLALVYFIFSHTMSFVIASLAFFFNRVHSFTFAKNIVLWLFTGSLFPLDLVPEPYRTWMLHLPFSSAVYVPVGYLTGRIGFNELLRGFGTVFLGLGVLLPFSMLIWNAGRRRYGGTGA